MLAQINLHDTYYNQHPTAILSTYRLGPFIGKLLVNIIVAAGVITFVYLILNGFNLINMAGKNANPQDIAKTRTAFIHTLLGFLLVVSSYFILQLIGTVTGIDFISPYVLN